MTDVEPFRYKRGKIGCLMVHGLTGTPWVFRELALALSQKGISVSAPLLPGHGTRPSDLIGIGWNEWVDSIRQEYCFFQSVCDQIFLCGLSMGGSISLLLASEYSVKGVISLSAPVQFNTWWAAVLPFLKRVKRYWKKRHKPASLEIGYDRYPLFALSELLMFLNEVKEKLPEITCPALIMHANEDKTVSSINADLIYSRISSSVKKKVLLERPCHVIIKGEGFPIIREEVLSFIRSNSSLTAVG